MRGRDRRSPAPHAPLRGMDKAPAQQQERIKAGGIKLSQELVQFTYSHPPSERSILAPALEAIAGRHISISYLTLTADSGDACVTICVEAEHHIVVRSILEMYAKDRQRLQCIPSIGTITIFPHRNSLTLLGRVIRAFACSRLPVYGLCTSISALSVNTAYPSLDMAVTALESVVELPANHAPFQQQFLIRQLGHHES